MEIIIHQTKEYSLFDTITGNRSINHGKVEKIVKDIEAGFNMLPYCPIIVSDKGGRLQIIDGQHRRVVSQQTKNPVYYVICNTLTLKQIAMLNSRGEKWKTSDFLNCYINLGIKSYKELKVVTIRHGIQLRNAIDMLMFNTPMAGSNQNSLEKFQSGEFEIRYLEETEHLLNLTNEIFDRYTFSKDPKLIAAVQTLFKNKKCDFEKLKAKIAQAPMNMDKCANTKLYLSNIERVYNFKSQAREVIF